MLGLFFRFRLGSGVGASTRSLADQANARSPAFDGSPIDNGSVVADILVT